MKDRNKTMLTHEVTEATRVWLDERGFKPIETEVPLCNGWCADLAAVICPTQTELIALKLIQRPPSWNEMHSLKTKRRTWDAATYRAWESVFHTLRRTMTCLVEVKTSRADYSGDTKWILPPPTDLAFVVFPRGMVRPEEWPVGWGILEFHADAIALLRTPTPRVTPDSQQRDIILSIAVRRDHHTRYSRFRADQKDTRLAVVAETSMARLRDVIAVVLSVARGEHSSLEECLAFSRLHKHMQTIPEWFLEPLRELYGIANPPPPPNTLKGE